MNTVKIEVNKKLTKRMKSEFEAIPNREKDCIIFLVQNFDYIIQLKKTGAWITKTVLRETFNVPDKIK